MKRITTYCIPLLISYYVRCKDQTFAGVQTLKLNIMKTLEQFTEDFWNIRLMKLFQLKVIDERIDEVDYITFHISVQGNQLHAEHIPLTQEQEDSNLIPFQSIDIDTVFSVNENLQELYDVCINAINKSDWYKLAE